MGGVCFIFQSLTTAAFRPRLKRVSDAFFLPPVLLVVDRSNRLGRDDLFQFISKRLGKYATPVDPASTVPIPKGEQEMLPAHLRSLQVLYCVLSRATSPLVLCILTSDVTIILFLCTIVHHSLFQ
jgi:hypothetical protein